MNDPWKLQMEALGSFIRVQAGLLEDGGEEGEAPAGSSVEAAIRTDPILSDDQKEALINVYRAMARDRRPS